MRSVKSSTTHQAGLSKYVKVKTWHVLALSAGTQIGLLIYAQHVDSHPERYGGLKYTDVDWRVISDGTRLIFNPNEGEGNIARGWLTQYSRLKIGDPYERSTYRYTPLLSLLISPCLINPLLGKLILVLVSLIISILLLDLSEQKNKLLIHGIWTIQPFVLNINTRGSPESIICLLSILILYNLKKNHFNLAAFCLGLSISYKIYPIIYVPAIWSFLSRSSTSKIESNDNSWFGKRIWKFGFVTALTLLLVNGLLWSIWGQPFIQHTFLYHLTRLDHRHNFSPYFHPIYLSLFPSDVTSSAVFIPRTIENILRHPLTSFLPQNTLVLLVGFILQPITGIEFTMFIQTAVFVIFNKVCTSQYFMWFLPFLPLIIPRLHFTRNKTIALISLWIVGQALWLSIGYQLEFLAKQVHIYLWLAGLTLFGISCWIIGELLDGFQFQSNTKDHSDLREKNRDSK
ncbi:uncharacterized protein L201_004856 [Kwoniella dendrophila CBS 6074]|uniref:GPI mannosyltransferase 1 n=1 Tax=Kwoniella dendrophila CBS 6074 TaxID=1295534 RepID=A0AAX4JX07_9TREE